MKPSCHPYLFSTFAALFAGHVSFAQNGSWALNGSGNWTDPANWAGGTLADGAGFTANFNALNPTADTTVTLNGDRTIGSLVFGDTFPFSAAGWTVTGNILTLDGGSPTITVNPLAAGKVATISSILAGTTGFTKSGAGTLVLSGANTLTGGIAVSQGTLRLGSATGIADGSAVTVSNGATFDYGGQGNVTTRNFNFSIGGAGVNGAGAMINSGAAIYGNSSIGSLTLTSDTSVGGTGRWDIGDGNAARTFNGGGFTLTKTGTNQIVFRPGNTNINLAAININQGTFTYEGFSRTTGDTSGMTNTMANGTTLDSYGTLSFNMPLVFNGAGNLTNGSGTSTWTGAVTLNGALTVNSGNPINLQGVVSGAGSLTKAGGGNLNLSNTSAFTGGTTVTAGTLTLGHATDTLANSGALTVTGGTLALGANSDTVGAVTMTGGTISGTGTLTGSSYTATAGTVTALLGGAAGVTKNGTGTLTFNSAATQHFSGGLTVNQGTAELNFANIAASTSLLNTASALTLAGGTIQLTGKASTTNLQNFNGLTLNAGAAKAVLNANATANPMLLNVGTITRNAGATLNITQPTGTIDTTNGFVTSNVNNATGILGGWATVGNANWAVANGASGVTALTTYTVLPTSGSSAATHYEMTAGTTLAASQSVATLKLTAPAGDLALGGNTLTVEHGGLLSTGTTARSITGTAGGTRLTAGNGTGAYELIVHQHNTGGLNIGAVIGNNGANAVALVKSGASVLTINNTTAANTYSGGTHVNEGTLSIGTGGTAADTARVDALGTGTVNVNAGGTLRLWIRNNAAFTIANNLAVNGGTILNEDGNHTLSGTVSVGALGATLTSKYTGKNLTFSNVISGAGAVTVTQAANADTQIIFTGANTYTGGTTVSSGILSLNGGGGASGTIRGTVNVNAGAQLRLGANDVTGYAGGAGALTTIHLNGATSLGGTGTLHIATNGSPGQNQTLGSATINMTGASITGVAGSNMDFFGGASALNSLASGTSSTVSGVKLNLRQNNGLVITVADGAAANDLVISSVITHADGFTNNNLTKAGPGTLVLTGANTYATGTNVNGGTLQIGDGGTAGNLGSGAVTVAGGATLSFNRSDATTVANAIGGVGTVAQTGAGTTTLSGVSTHTGVLAVNAGRLNLAGSTASALTVNSLGTLGGAGSTSGALTTVAGAQIFLSGANPNSALTAGAVDFSGATWLRFDTVPAPGSSSHVVVNYTSLTSGTANLNTSDYRGGTITNDTLNNRVLLDISTATRTWNRSTPGNWDAMVTQSWLEGDQLFSQGDAVVFNDTATDGTVTLVGALMPYSITVNNSATAYTFGGAGSIAGTTGLAKSGNGLLTLNTANTFTGKTSINGGVVAIGADNRLGTAPVSAVADQLALNGGTLRITAGGQTLAANRGVTIGAAGATFDTDALPDSANNTTTIAGKITGAGPVTIKANGDQSNSGGGSNTLGIDLQNAANDFTGNITVTSGFLSYASNAALGNAANKIILSNGGGLLDANRNVALARDIEIQGAGNTFRTWGGANTTWSGKLTGSGTVNRTDAGTLSLSGDLSGFTGTFDNKQGNTNLTGTAPTIGGNWIATGGVLAVNSAANQTLAGNISGAGGQFNKSGAGTLTLTGDNSGLTGGGIGVSGGVLSVSTISDTGTGSQIGNWTTGGNPYLAVNGGTFRYTGAAAVTTQRYLWVDNNGGGTIEVTDAGASLFFNSTGGNITQRLTKAGAGTLIIADVINGAAGAVTVNGGTLNLAGTNTHTGSTLVNGGTLVLDSAAGAMTGATAITVAGGGTLRIDNSTNNLGDRVGTGALTLTGGTLQFLHDGDAGVNYSETLGALAVNGAGSTVSTSQAAAGQTSTLTFASLGSTGGTLNFSGAGLGATVDPTNEIRFTTDPKVNGIIGVWATVNGADLATTTGANNSIVAFSGYTDIDARGPSSIPDGAAGHIRIVGDGTAGNVDLAAATTTVGSLSMTNGAFASTVDTAGKTLATGGLLMVAGAQALTLGAAAGDGTLTPATAGGTLTLNNLSAGNPLTVNAVIADNTSASRLAKTGAGTVVLAGSNTFTGAVDIGGGKLVTSAAANLGATSTVLNINNGATLQAVESYTLGRRINLGAGGGTVEVDAAKTLTHTNGFTGGTTLSKAGAGTFNFTGYGAGGFSGHLVVNEGTVRFGAGLFNGSIGLSSITVNNGGTLLSPAGVAHSLGGYITATPALVINAGGQYRVDQEQYLNAITLNGGTISGTNEIRTDNNFQVNVAEDSGWSARISGVQQDLRFNVAAGKNLDLSGTITGNRPLVKSGTGTLSLSGTGSTFTGASLVNEGTLAIATGGILSTSGNIQVAPGASLLVNGSHTGGGLIQLSAGATLGGNGTVGNGTSTVLTIGPGAILAPGNSAGHFTVDGMLTLAADAQLNFELGAPTEDQGPGSDFVTVNNMLTLGGVLNIIPIAGFGTPVYGDRWKIMTSFGGDGQHEPP
jgi:fibronectin-binding autotransporter adhesin